MIIPPEIFQFADMIVKELPKGRAADTGASLPFVGEMVRLARNGDHCEIGCLYGASAIMAALVKEHYNLGGSVITIDPFESREVNTAFFSDKVPADQHAATVDEVMENVNYFKVGPRIQIVQAKSYPWPTVLEKSKFVSSYIDGFHLGLGPWMDFLSLRERTQSFIGFDNFEENYPDVMAAALRATTIGGWILHYKCGLFFSLRRPLVVPDKKTFKNDKEYELARHMARDYAMV